MRPTANSRALIAEGSCTPIAGDATDSASGRLTASQYHGELLGRHGLYDKGVESSLGAPLTIFGSAITCQRDEEDAGAKALTDFTRNLVSIESR